MNKLSCIIPAYNEEKNMEYTLRAVTSLPHLIAEVVVVNDASTDATASIVCRFPEVKLLTQERNKGKSNCVAVGVEVSTGDYILLLDADLLGISAEAIAALVEPVRRGESEVSISMRSNSPWWMRVIWIDTMSGERIFPRWILEGRLEEMKGFKGFELEMFLNELFVKHGLPITTVWWSNVGNNMKWNKRGSFWHGMYKEIEMWLEIFAYISPFRILAQTISLARLIRRPQK